MVLSLVEAYKEIIKIYKKNIKLYKYIKDLEIQIYQI